MAVPLGLEHVEATLRLIERASDTLTKLDGVEGDWKTETVARLASSAGLLRATMDRFFIKTRVCLPFARKCEKAAMALDERLDALSARPDPGTQRELTAALDALEKAVRTLDERSTMQGMAIT